MFLTRRYSRWWSSLPLFWRVQLVGWLAFIVFSFPFKLLALGSVKYVLGVSLVREPLGMAWTSGLRLVYRKLGLTLAQPVRLAGWVLFLCLVTGFTDGMVWEYLNGSLLRLQSKLSMDGMFYPRTLIYCCWSFLFFWIKDYLGAQERALTLALAKTQAREAELKMLRAQVSPHFLFNAFNTVLAGLERDPKELAPVVQSLADYFRYSLSNSHDTFVPLRQEFEAVVNYLAVEKARFRDALLVETHLDPAAREVLVPGVILQPLLENALKYGHRTSATPLKISLRVELAPAGRLVVEVGNSGHWIEPPPSPQRERVGGSGLASLHRRLELIWPEGSIPAPKVTERDGFVFVCMEVPC